MLMEIRVSLEVLEIDEIDKDLDSVIFPPGVVFVQDSANERPGW